MANTANKIRIWITKDLKKLDAPGLRVQRTFEDKVEVVATLGFASVGYCIGPDDMEALADWLMIEANKIREDTLTKQRMKEGK